METGGASWRPGEVGRHVYNRVQARKKSPVLLRPLLGVAVHTCHAHGCRSLPQLDRHVLEHRVERAALRAPLYIKIDKERMLAEG